jgi:hypothetical protein
MFCVTKRQKDVEMKKANKGKDSRDENYSRMEERHSNFQPKKVILIKKFGKHKTKRDTTIVRCVLNVMDDGNTYLDTRQFYLDGGTDDWLPTRKGISIHMDHLLTFQKAVNKAVRTAKKKGWLDHE